MRWIIALLCAGVVSAVDVTLQVYGTCDPALLSAPEQTAATTASATVFRSLHYGSVVVTANDASAFTSYPIYRAQLVPQVVGATITGYRVAAVFADAQGATGNLISSSIKSYDPMNRPVLGIAGSSRLRPYVLSGASVSWYQLNEGAVFASDLDAQSLRWSTRRFIGYAVDDGAWVHACGARVIASTAIASSQALSAYAGAWVQMRQKSTGNYLYVRQRNIVHDTGVLYDPVRYDGELITAGGYEPTADPLAWRASYRLDTLDCAGSFSSANAVNSGGLPIPINTQASASELPAPPAPTVLPLVDSSTQRGAMPVVGLSGTQNGTVSFYADTTTKANSTVDLNADINAVNGQASSSGNAQAGLMDAIAVGKPNPSSGAIANGSVSVTYAPDPLTGIAAMDPISGQQMSITADADANKLVLVRYDDLGNPIEPQNEPVVQQPAASQMGNDVLTAIDTANAVIAPHIPGGATWSKPARNVHHGSAIYPIDLYDTTVMANLGKTRRVPLQQHIGASLEKGYSFGEVLAGESIDLRYEEGGWNIVPDLGTGVILRSPDGDGVPMAVCAAVATSAPVPSDLLAAYPWLDQVPNVVAWVPRGTRSHMWTFTAPTNLGEVWLACPDAGNRNDNVGSVTYWVTFRSSANAPPRDWTDRSGQPSPGEGDNPSDPHPRGSEAFCGRPFYDFDDDGDLDRWYTDDPFDGGYKRLRVQWRVEDGNKQFDDFSYSHGNHIMVSGLTKPKLDPSSGLWVVQEDLLLHFCHNHKPFHHKSFSLTKGYKTYYSGSHATMLDPIDSSDPTIYQFALKNYGVTEADDDGSDGVSASDMIPVIQTDYVKTPKDLNGDGTIDPNEYEAKRTTVTWYVNLGTFYDSADPNVKWNWSPAFTLPASIADRPLVPAIITQNVEKADGTIISTLQVSRPVETDPATGVSIAFNPALVPVAPPPPPGSVTAKSDGYQYDYPHDKATAAGGMEPSDPQSWKLPWNIIPSSKTSHCSKTFGLNSANLDYFDPIWKTKTPKISHAGLLNDLTMSGGIPRVQWIVKEIASANPVSQTQDEWRDGQVLYTLPGWVQGTEWLKPGRSMLHLFGWDSRTDMCYASRNVGDIRIKSGSRFYEIISGLGEYYFRGKKYRPVTVDEQQKLLIRMWNYYFTGYESPEVTSTGGFAILPSLAIPQRYDNEIPTSRPLNQAAIAIDATAAVSSNSDANKAGNLGGRLFRDIENPVGDPDSQHRAAVERRTNLMKQQVYIFSAARGREWELEYAKRMPSSVRLVCVEWENQSEVKSLLHDRDLRFPEVKTAVTTDASGVATTTTTSAETEILKELSKTWFDGVITKMGYKSGGFGKTLSGGSYSQASAEAVGSDVSGSSDGFVKHLPEGLPAARAAFAYELRSGPLASSRQWMVDPGQDAMAGYTVEFRHPMLLVYHDRASMLYVHYGRNTDPDEVFGAWDQCAPQLSPINAQSPEFRRRKRFEDWATTDNLAYVYQHLHPDGYADWLATRGNGPTPPENPGGEPQQPTPPQAPNMPKPIPPVEIPAPTQIRNWDTYPGYTYNYTDAIAGAYQQNTSVMTTSTGSQNYTASYSHTTSGKFSSTTVDKPVDLSYYSPYPSTIKMTSWAPTALGQSCSIVINGTTKAIVPGQSYSIPAGNVTLHLGYPAKRLTNSGSWWSSSTCSAAYTLTRKSDVSTGVGVKTYSAITDPDNPPDELDGYDYAWSLWDGLPGYDGLSPKEQSKKYCGYEALTEFTENTISGRNFLPADDGMQWGSIPHYVKSTIGVTARTANQSLLLFIGGGDDSNYGWSSPLGAFSGNYSGTWNPFWIPREYTRVLTTGQTATWWSQSTGGNGTGVGCGYLQVFSPLQDEFAWYSSIYDERHATVLQAQTYLLYLAQKQQYDQDVAYWSVLWDNYTLEYEAYLQDQAAWQTTHALWQVKKNTWDAWVVENQAWLTAKARGDAWIQDRDAWTALVQAEISPAGVSWSGDPGVTKSTLVEIKGIIPQIPIWEAYGWFIDSANAVPEGVL